MDLAKIFEEVSIQMRCDFDKARSALSHPGLKGSANEEAVRNFFKQYLPNTLEITTGMLVDSDGQQSKQLDIIICDAANTPTFYRSGELRVIPVECAYAVIEIKAYLDKPELQAANQNMTSVKALSKKAFFPQRGPVISTHNLYGKEWHYWPVHYFVFAFESADLNSVQTNLIELQSMQAVENRIDMICILDKGVILNRDVNGQIWALPTPGTSTVSIFTNKPLLLFFTLMSIILNQARMLGAVNLLPYLGAMKF